MEKSNEFFEKWGFSIKGSEFEDVLLEKADDEFMKFWLTSFGKPKKTDSTAVYTEKMMFVLTGWLAANKYIERLEPNEDTWEEKSRLLRDRIEFLVQDENIKNELLGDIDRMGDNTKPIETLTSKEPVNPDE